MGVSTMAQTQDALLRAGMAPSTPVAMVENASLAQQRHRLSTLADMLADARDFGLRSPAILVVGQVVGIAEALVPLSGASKRTGTLG